MNTGWPKIKPITQCFFNLFMAMKNFGAFRLLAKPRAVTQRLCNVVLFQMVRNIMFLNYVVQKNPIDTWVYVCNTVIVA